MLKAITRFSVSYPVTVSMIIIATVLLGYISFDRLGIDLFPNLHSPKLYIEVQSGERPPEEMEEKFVDQMESVAIRQTGVVNVSSVSRVGVAQIEVEYTWEQDMNEAFLDLSKALAPFNQDSDIDELNISQFDPNAEPVMLVAMTHRTEENLSALYNVADGYIRNELIRLEGIADVAVDGAEEMEVLVETSEYLMDSYGVTLSDISSRINSYNQDISGGSIVEMGRRYIVRGISELEQIDDLKDVIISMEAPEEDPDGERVPVYLRDVATVSYIPKEKETAVLLNGEPCIGLSIYKEMRYNTVRAVDDLREALTEMERSLPGYEFTVISDQGEFISGAIGEVRDSLIGGIILAVFVLMLFLRRIGPTAIVSLAIPISIIATFVLMYFFDLTLNIMTLGGLALGAGMLVDNAIVVLENIFRVHESGESESEAAVQGTSQVGGAIIASTITTIVVFIPIVYLHGASGELFKEQAFTVAFSLLCSLVVAILIIPMLYSRLYRKRSPFGKKKRSSLQFTAYGHFLERVLRFRGWVIVAATVLILGGWLMLQRIGSEFMPRTDTGEFFIDLTMPEGTMLERTLGAVETMEQIVRDLGRDAVMQVYSEIGPTSGLSSTEGGVFNDQNMATIKVILDPEGGLTAASLIPQMAGYFDNERAYSIQFRQEETALQSLLGNDESPLVIEIRGDDLDELELLANQSVTLLKGVEGIYNLETSIEGGAPEVEIVIDRFRAGLMNVDVSTLIGRVSEKLQGVESGQMNLSGELTDITLKLGDLSMKELEMLSVEVNNTDVLLNELAQIRIGRAPREIRHMNQNRIVEITADLGEGMPLDQAAMHIEEQLSQLELPADYTYHISGEEQMRKESMSNLLFALLLSLIMVYMVLAAQFENLVHPFIIILTVPLAVVGAVAVFFIQGAALNIMAIIGIIMLVGIAVNDSIILVDAINQFRREGLALREAVIAAGQRRIRPILMTTFTTILALLPLTFDFGESASLRSPMAWAVIGGLITSTLLTLVVIPSLYVVFGSLEGIFKKKEEPAGE